MKHFLMLATALASYSSFTVAQTQRDLDSHVHGAATLNIAFADSAVFIELNTPWNNLVGFEHSPNTDEQQAMVDEALKQLNDPVQLFLFDAGGCSIDEIVVDSSMLSESHTGGHDEHGDEHADGHGHDDEHADEHGHDDEHGEEHAEAHGHDDEHADKHADGHGHDDKHADEHADGHGHDDEHGEVHTTVLVTYSYLCDQVDELASIDVALFSIWPGFDDLDVQLIGATGQALEELNPQNTVLNLESVK